MPYSDDSNIGDIQRLLEEYQPKSVLDIGAGAGKYGRLVKRVLPETTTVHAVEVWGPYIKEFSLNEIYAKIYMMDVRNVSQDVYDLYEFVIFGDVLEHMTKDEAVRVFDKVNSSAIISIPIVHWPQGHEHGNPYEEHVKDDWSVQEVLDTFPVRLIAESESTAVFFTG